MGSLYSAPPSIQSPVAKYVSPIKKTFKLTDNGDIFFGEGERSPQFISGLEKIKQDISVIVRSLQGSSSFNPSLGLNVFEIVEHEYDPIIIESEVESAVLRHPDVDRIENMNVSRSSVMAQDTGEIRNHYFVEFYVKCKDGESIFVSVTI